MNDEIINKIEWMDVHLKKINAINEIESIEFDNNVLPDETKVKLYQDKQNILSNCMHKISEIYDLIEDNKIKDNYKTDINNDPIMNRAIYTCKEARLFLEKGYKIKRNTWKNKFLFKEEENIFDNSGARITTEDLDIFEKDSWMVLKI